MALIDRLMLDTNAVSALVKGRAGRLSELMTGRSACISVITEAELRFGVARTNVHADLRRIAERILATVDILPWTSDCARQYGSLRARLERDGRPLAPVDLLIAAHALAEKCTLVTSDRAFSRVSGLEVLVPPALDAKP